MIYVSQNLQKVNKWKHCHNCLKSGTISIINLKGRTWKYWMDKTDIEIKFDVFIIGCTACDNYILGPNDCEMLDEVLKASCDD